MAVMAGMLKALSNPNRLKVYQTICRKAKKGGPGITIEQICTAAKMKQPAVSHYVARLAAAGLVERRKARWWVHCFPCSKALDALRRFSKDPAAFPG